VFTVRGTKKFLDRVGRPVPAPPATTTVLGDWYANVLFWRPQVALFVNEATFVPVLVPLAPATGVVGRFPAAMDAVFTALGIDRRFIDTETTEMRSAVLAKTASRQVLGVMNEFAFMAEHAIGPGCADSPDPVDPVGMSVWLSNTIVGPIGRDDGYTPVGALQRRVVDVGG
jgi:hypothetical protein